MKLLPLFLLLLLPITSRAGVTIVSPQRAEVSPYYSARTEQLHRLPGGALVATVIFDNEQYVSDIEPKRTERVDFVIPGAHWDEASGTWSIRSSSGRLIPVASAKRGLFNNVVLLPNSRIHLLRSGSKVALTLEADARQPGERWVEDNSGPGGAQAN